MTPYKSLYSLILICVPIGYRICVRFCPFLGVRGSSDPGSLDRQILDRRILDPGSSDPGSILDRFWVDFGRRFWIDFGWILGADFGWILPLVFAPGLGGFWAPILPLVWVDFGWILGGSGGLILDAQIPTYVGTATGRCHLPVQGFVDPKADVST